MTKTHLFSAAIILFMAILSIYFLAEEFCDDKGSGINRYMKRRSNQTLPFLEESDDGNEITGAISLVFLGIANLPVIFSILIKRIARTEQLKEKKWDISLNTINKTQKKAFMGAHYYLNMGVFFLSILHWLLSSCRSTVIPELGIMLMMILIVSGFLMKFKRCPRKLKKYIFNFHTAPQSLIIVCLLLTTGHLIVD